MDYQFTVVVCTYNGSETIRGCIESLIKQSFSQSYEIIVVDDGSTDNTLTVLEKFQQDIKIIEHGTNKGLGTARNTGWEAARGDIVAYIDDDAKAPEDWLQSLYSYYDDDVDGVGGYSSTLIDNYIGRYEVARMEVVYGPNAERVDGAGGMNMSFKKNILAEVDGFDERFTHIGDDTDINKRLNQKGYNLRVVPEIRVEHQYPKSIFGFISKKFNRGLGRAVIDEKYGNENIFVVMAASLIYPFLLPIAAIEARKYNNRTSKYDFVPFIILYYIERITENWGTLYHMF